MRKADVAEVRSEVRRTRRSENNVNKSDKAAVRNAADSKQRSHLNKFNAAANHRFNSVGSSPSVARRKHLTTRNANSVGSSNVSSRTASNVCSDNASSRPRNSGATSSVRINR